MRGIRVTHKGVPFQFEQVPRSFALLKALLDANFPKVKVETLTSPDLGGVVIRSDEDLVNVYTACSGKGGLYCELRLEGKEPRSFCCSKPRNRGLSRARNEDEKEAVQLYGKMPCFKCANNKSGTCKLCSGSGEISAQAPTKYRSLLQSVQKTVESLVKRVQTLALQGKARRRKRPNLHLTPIVGV